MKEILFAVDFVDGELVLTTTPKSYWEKNHCIYDRNGTGNKKADNELNYLGWYEIEESTWNNEKKLSRKKAIEALTAVDFIYSQEMTDWLNNLTGYQE